MANEFDGNELDKYIDDVAGIESEGDDTAGTEDVGAEGGATDEGTQQTQQPTSDDAPTNQAAQGEGAPANPTGTPKQEGQQPQEGSEGTKQDQLRPLGDGTFADSKGNIVDQQGKVIAERGFAARVYQKTRRQDARIQEQDRTIQELSSRVRENDAIMRASQQYGLSTDDFAQAVDLAGRVKRGDVVGVAKEVVALAVAAGYNVTDILGQDVGDSIEMRAVKQMLDERFAPIQQQQQQGREQQERMQRARTAYNEFVSTNEHAETHADAIAGVMKREGVNAQTAYNRLLSFAAKNGLDFSQPLGPQIQARQAQQGQQRQNKQAQPKPMPNGASTRTPGAAPTVKLADADDDWASIISEVQRSVGSA